MTELNFEYIRRNDEKYWRLLEIERRYCRKHAVQINDLAHKIYRIGCNSDHKLHDTCCDFALLERIYKDYAYNMHNNENIKT